MLELLLKMCFTDLNPTLVIKIFRNLNDEKVAENNYG